jgi:multidrug efflux pump subunit AcrA (membrane-fusion protein)
MVKRFPYFDLGILALAVVLIYGCAEKASPAKSQRQRNQSVSIQTTAVQHISIERQVELSGTLISPDQARVSSEVAGKVMDVLVEIGQEVTEGQELVRLDPTELKLALERAESALHQTEAQLGIDSSRPDQLPADESIAAVLTAAATRDDARAQLARANELISKQLLSKAELDNNQTKVKVSEATYQAALENVRSLKASLQDRRAAYDLAKKKLNDAVIRAPVPGAIADRTVQRGEYLRENTQVAMIVRMHPLKLRTAVQEKYANLVHQNQIVDFHVEPFPNETFHGKIAFISPAVDPSSRTFAVEVLVDNPQRRLKPGFFAKGQASISRDDGVVAVPEGSISTLAGVSSVYLIENGAVKQQTVQLGEHSGQFVEILSGLKGNEILAVSNLNELVTGLKVDVDDEGGPTGGDDSGGAGKRPRGSKPEKGEKQ